MFRRISAFALGCLLLSLVEGRNLFAQQPQNDSGDAPQASTAAYAEIVRTDQPVAYWRFEDDKATGEHGASHWSLQQKTGDVKFLQSGPRQQKFPLFDAGNQAVVFEKAGSLRYDDTGERSPFDFAAGDSITLEAWINPTKIASGAQIYIIGKGRTGNKGFCG